MKKLVIMLSIACLIMSCKKISNCYECSFGLINSVKPANQEYCGKDPEKHIFQDKDGNVLNVLNCEHK